MAGSHSRILYVSTSTTIGGAEKTLYTLATLLDPKVARVTGVVSLKPLGGYGKRLKEAGHRVYSLDSERAGFREVQRLAFIIHETRPDIVHAVMYQAIQLCRAVKRLGYADFKLVSSPRVHYRTRSGTSIWIDGFLKKSDDLLITECDASRDYLVDKLGYAPEKTKTIRNGVDIAGWPISRTARKKRREELGLGEGDILVGAVGRLDEQKGHATLLEAMAKLKAVRTAKCVILGRGPLHDRLGGMIRSLGLAENARLVGETGDIPSWLSALDIFCLPSLWEGLPNAVLEAMALGLPVVASRVDGVPEAVAHEVSGILVPPKDSQSLYVALQDLSSDKAYREKLGANAKKVVSENFQLSTMLDNYQNAYTPLLQVE